MYSLRIYNTITTCCRTGIIIFLLVYIVATWYYPGGSDADRYSKGFSWLHNYWCELLAPTTKSGQVNTSRPVALAGFILLDLVLMLCWLQASFLFPRRAPGGIVLAASGLLSGIALWFLSSPSHDIIINISGGFGLLAISLTLAGLIRWKFYAAFSLGIICILLFFLNTYIYYTGTWFDALAVVQKISFAAFLGWFWIVAAAGKATPCFSGVP